MPVALRKCPTQLRGNTVPNTIPAATLARLLAHPVRIEPRPFAGDAQMINTQKGV